MIGELYSQLVVDDIEAREGLCCLPDMDDSRVSMLGSRSAMPIMPRDSRMQV